MNLYLYITFIKFAVSPFLTSENDVICTITLRHLSQFWRMTVGALYHYIARKELFSSLKGIFSLGKMPPPLKLLIIASEMLYTKDDTLYIKVRIG